MVLFDKEAGEVEEKCYKSQEECSSLFCSKKGSLGHLQKQMVHRQETLGPRGVEDIRGKSILEDVSDLRMAHLGRDPPHAKLSPHRCLQHHPSQQTQEVNCHSWTWWQVPIILTFGRLRQGDRELKAMGMGFGE